MFETYLQLRSRSWTPLGVMVGRLFTLRLAERLRLSAQRGGRSTAAETVRYAGVAFEEVWLVARSIDEDHLRRAIEWESEILLRHGIDWTLSAGPIPPTWPELIPVSSNSLAAEYCGVDASGRFLLGFDGAVRSVSLSDQPSERLWTSTLFTFDEGGALVDAAIELFSESSGGDGNGGVPPECVRLDQQIATRGYTPRDSIVIRPFTLDFEGFRFGFERRTAGKSCGYTVLPGGKELTLPHLQVWYG